MNGKQTMTVTRHVAILVKAIVDDAGNESAANVILSVNGQEVPTGIVADTATKAVEDLADRLAALGGQTRKLP